MVEKWIRDFVVAVYGEDGANLALSFFNERALVKSAIGLIASLRGELAEEKQRRQETVDMCSQLRGELAQAKDSDGMSWECLEMIKEALMAFGCKCGPETHKATPPMMYPEWIGCVVKTHEQKARETALENVAAWFEKKMFYDAADAVRSFKPPDVQPCGHPASAIVSSDGTHYCGACAEALPEQENPIEPPTREGA